MNYHQAIGIFAALEADIVRQAALRGRTLSCDIATRSVDAREGIVTIRATTTGMLTYIAPDGVTELSRDQFMASYVIPDAERADALHRARRNARTAAKNIRSISRARRGYYKDAAPAPLTAWPSHVNDKTADSSTNAGNSNREPTGDATSEKNRTPDKPHRDSSPPADGNPNAMG